MLRNSVGVIFVFMVFFFVTVFHHFPCAVLSIPTIYLCFVITMFPFCIYFLHQPIENVYGNIKYISDGFFLIRFVCGRMVLKHYLSSWVLVYIIMSAKKVSRNNWISFNFVVFESVMVENWLVYFEEKKHILVQVDLLNSAIFIIMKWISCEWFCGD